MIDRLCSRHVVLLGIGHTNAHVLRMWRMNPIPDADLTCLSNFSVATYSGMMPAVLAGQVEREAMEIDLVRLCASTGARLLTDRVIGIDHSDRRVLFADRPAVPFDVLSIGIGSTATRAGVRVEGESLVEVKPMQTFLDRLEAAVKRTERSTIQVCVVGGGVAGVEISTCVPGFMERITKRPFTISLLTGGPEVLPSVNGAARRKVESAFRQRGIRLRVGSPVRRVSPSSIELENGEIVDADVVIWATGATAPPLLEHLKLPLDDRGFIETDSTLQATSTKHIFAVGDTGTIKGQDLPKAGVYAVRQGPVLWQNIENAIGGRPLQTYRPQQSFLKLINLGDGRAVGAWKGLAMSGRWMMHWKERIDGRFMEMFQVQPMQGDEPDAMQCRGCGCKLDTDALAVGLGDIDSDGPEDAAAIGPSGSGLVASTDFFSSPVDDPFLAGRIAAIHSASDIIASGATPTEALANIVVPEGSKGDQQRVLFDLMAGAKREFDRMGATIVGGHTIVGPRMETGFTVIGKMTGRRMIRKRNLKIGDALLLTKPIGVGILLAAQMRSQCRADWYESMVESMLLSQLPYAYIASDLGITAGTDVTGFGLAGHLVEMLTASAVSADLHLDRVPTLPGVEELIGRGIESSLAPGNRIFAKKIEASQAARESTRYEMLFDPQTCGGLLLAVPEDQLDKFRQAARTKNLPEPVDIGRVSSVQKSGPMLRIVSADADPSIY